MSHIKCEILTLMETKAVLRRGHTEVSCWRNRAPKPLWLHFKKVRADTYMPEWLESTPSSWTIGSRSIMEMPVWSHASCHCSPIWAKSRVTEPHSQAFRVPSHLCLIISERCHEVAFDAIPRQGRTNLKGRKTDMLVLHSAVFSFHVQDILGFITFAAFVPGACVLSDVERAVFTACFKIRMQICVMSIPDVKLECESMYFASFSINENIMKCDFTCLSNYSSDCPYQVFLRRGYKFLPYFES